VRAFVTGANRFVGGALARALRERGDEVVALVPAPAKAAALRERGCRVVGGDATSFDRRQLRGCDAVFHTSADGTERLLAASVEASVSRIVHVSTLSAFGDTRRRVVDEAYRRSAGPFASAEDEAAWRALEAARTHAVVGPVRIAVVGAVYGPGERSHLGRQLQAAMSGRLRFVGYPALGLNAVHIDDAVAGVLLVHDRGADGEEYVLGGELTTLRRLVSRAALAAGRRPPRLTVPTTLLRLGGLAPATAVSDRASYWASDAKARRELGYAPRGLDRGLADTAAATG
jgi:dihydroflavonol-4-reductase